MHCNFNQFFRVLMGGLCLGLIASVPAHADIACNGGEWFEAKEQFSLSLQEILDSTREPTGSDETTILDRAETAAYNFCVGRFQRGPFSSVPNSGRAGDANVTFDGETATFNCQRCDLPFLDNPGPVGWCQTGVKEIVTPPERLSGEDIKRWAWQTFENDAYTAFEAAKNYCAVEYDDQNNLEYAILHMSMGGGGWRTAYREPSDQPQISYSVSDGLRFVCAKCVPQPPVEVRKGMTWGKIALHEPTGAVRVGCNGICDAREGDTECTTELPLLCFKPGEHPRPASLQDSNGQYHKWSGGTVATTAPVAASSFAELSDADAACAAEFGSGWRVAEYHDGVGHSLWAYGNVSVLSERYWADINDQPGGTCWSN